MNESDLCLVLLLLGSSITSACSCMKRLLQHLHGQVLALELLREPVGCAGLLAEVVLHRGMQWTESSHAVGTAQCHEGGQHLAHMLAKAAKCRSGSSLVLVFLGPLVAHLLFLRFERIDVVVQHFDLHPNPTLTLTFDIVDRLTLFHMSLDHSQSGNDHPNPNPNPNPNVQHCGSPHSILHESGSLPIRPP